MCAPPWAPHLSYKIPRSQSVPSTVTCLRKFSVFPQTCETRSLVLKSHPTPHTHTCSHEVWPHLLHKSLSDPPHHPDSQNPHTSLCSCSGLSPPRDQRASFKKHHLDHTTPSSKLARDVSALSVKSQVPTVAPASSHAAISRQAAPPTLLDASLASGPLHELLFCLECSAIHPTVPEWLACSAPDCGRLVEVISSPYLPHLQHLSQLTTTGLSASCISGP